MISVLQLIINFKKIAMTKKYSNKFMFDWERKELFIFLMDMP